MVYTYMSFKQFVEQSPDWLALSEPDRQARIAAAKFGQTPSSMSQAQLAQHVEKQRRYEKLTGMAPSQAMKPTAVAGTTKIHRPAPDVAETLKRIITHVNDSGMQQAFVRNGPGTVASPANSADLNKMINLGYILRFYPDKNELIWKYKPNR